MKIKKLKINNFKGINTLEINFGDLTIIKGANGTGKTSIIDAFYWLLFGKNSEDQKDFGVKPYGSTLSEPSVTAWIENNGRKIKLQRILKEKWMRKRGSDKEELIGHETEYLIDDIEVQAGKFNEFIQSFCSEQNYKILSNPYYFAQNLSWTERRKLIMEAIDSYTIENSIRDKYKIPYDVNVEQYKTQLRRKKTEIKKELESYPIRISEVEKMLPEEINVSELTNRKNEIELKIKEFSDLITAIDKETQAANASYFEALRRRSEIESKIKSLEIERQSLINQAKQEELRLENERIQRNKTIERYKVELESLRIELDNLRQEYKAEQMKQFPGLSEGETICFACGQALPVEKIKELQITAETKFLEEKRRKLESISSKGKSIADSVAHLEQVIAELEQNTIVAQSSIDTSKINIDIEQLRVRLNEIKLPEIQKRNDEVEQIELERKRLYDELSVINEKITEQQNREKLLKRIDELKLQWKENGDELTVIEREEINIENFEIELAEAIQKAAIDSIAIEGLEIVMFKKLLNGNIEPCCEVYYKGVAYNDLNHAAKVEIGVKLINFLSKFYQISLPLFIDNAESLNELPHYEGQLIATYVTDDKVLTIKN